MRFPTASTAFRRLLAADLRGQSTVEFAVITAGVLALLVALGLFARAMRSGLFSQHALTAASHHVGSVTAAALADVFLF